jgi:hypothetical protein
MHSLYYGIEVCTTAFGDRLRELTEVSRFNLERRRRSIALVPYVEPKGTIYELGNII